MQRNAETRRRRDAKRKFFWLCISPSLRLCVNYLALLAFPVIGALPVPPADWRIEVIASAPDVQHPSVVCAAPDGRVFVAEDPMDIRVAANSAQGRILCFYPDGRRTVFAEKLYAVFGMQYLEGSLYVLHNPKFSVFTPTGRVDLIESTHPNPWALEWNDHVPANFKLAMDGYFYIAVGDKGMYGAVGRDGKRLDLHGGGIVRMRPDGTGLEIFATGVRNILDVAINEEDEIFTYDNTDEHEWMGRLTHMVERGFYGYPFDFIPRRPYTLWMMADLGGGAATGAFVYDEDALPPKYRGNLFLADFGKRQLMRVVVARDGARYRVVSRQDFFTDPPEDFRPVGIALGADALSIYICDWNHRDTKENVTVGRVLKLSYTGKSHATPAPTNLVEALSHPARSVRLAAQRQLKEDVLDRVSDERALWHAIWLSTNVARCLADERASVRRQALRRNLLPAAEVRRCLSDQDASVRFHAVTALGKIGIMTEVPPLQKLLADSDSVVRFGAFTALNAIGRAHADAWPLICKGLRDDDPLIREHTAFALRNTYDLALVKVLETIGTAEAVRLLAPLHHKAPEWKGEWWAYHPFNTTPPAKTVPWEGTAIIMPRLRASLTNAEPIVIHALAEAGDAESIPQLRKLLEGNPRLEVLRALLKAAGALRIHSPALVRSASHSAAEVRSAAIDALITVDREGAAEKILPLLKHSDAAVRASAVTALGSLKNKSTLDPLLAAYNDPATREQAIVALAQIPDVKAVDAYADGLTRTNLMIRESARKAVRAIRNDARPILEKRPELAQELRLIYGSETAASSEDYLREGLANKGDGENGQKLFARLCAQCHVVRGQGGNVGPDLTTVGAQFSRREIAESILFPSKAVREGYQAVNIETRDGDFLSGLLKGETADEITLADSGAQLHRIPKKLILSRKLSELSLMPEGLHAALTVSEFSDLLSYLESLRQ
ncbi:MAG TPA: HEAT repeat domain-containing protein [Verrucomicrobiae bacterium]|nr:HEAT repeat domain-containing protein [Verrucomicrobiae bacterium]